MHVAMLSHDIDGASNDKFSADAQTCCAEQMADCSVYCRLTECKLLYLIGVCTPGRYIHPEDVFKTAMCFINACRRLNCFH